MKKIILTLAIAISSLAGTQQTMAQSESRLTCLSGNKVAPSKIGEYLNYELKFDTPYMSATNKINVKLYIDSNQFDISSIQMEVTQNYFEVLDFEIIDKTLQLSGGPGGQGGVLLKGGPGGHGTVGFRVAGNGGPGRHGTVGFKIKTKSDLSANAVASIEATIKADNTTITKYSNIEQTIFDGGSSEAIDASIQAYPIPADENLTVACSSIIRSVELLGENNQVVETIVSNEPSKSFDISSKLDGIYYVRVTSDNGQKVIRIVKQ
jgi:hypothetical protein